MTSSDRDAEFSAFMAADAGALMHTAWLLCGDVHRAEELTQQALVSTYLAWPRARDTDPLAYARRCLANARIDTWRRRRREVLTGDDGLGGGMTSGHENRVADRDRLVRALALLPARQRRIVVLRHFLDLSEAEVAEDLGVSVGTVKSTASRALARLREELALAGTVLDAHAAAESGTPATLPVTADERPLPRVLPDRSAR